MMECSELVKWVLWNYCLRESDLVTLQLRWGERTVQVFLLNFNKALIGGICDISETIWRIYSVYETIITWMTANIHNYVMWMTANRLNGDGSLSNRGICIWWGYQITDGRMQLNIITGSQDSWDRKVLQEQDHPEQVAQGFIQSMCTNLRGWRLHNLS